MKQFSRGIFISWLAVWLLSFIAIFTGCETDSVNSYEPETFEGWSYVMAGAATMDNQHQDIEPDKPSSDICQACNGTGKVGDGRIFKTCLDCGGDGKIDGNESLPEHPAKQPEKKKPEPRPVQQAVIYSEPSTPSGFVCGPDGCRPVSSSPVVGGRLLGRFRR